MLSDQSILHIIVLFDLLGKTTQDSLLLAHLSSITEKFSIEFIYDPQYSKYFMYFKLVNSHTSPMS